MEWDDNNICRMVAYVNQELAKGRTMVDIEREFGVNERVIHKRLVRKGYKKIDNKYTKDMDFKNMTKPLLSEEKLKEIAKNMPPLPIHLRENDLANKKEKVRHRSKNSNTDNNIKSNINILGTDEIIAIRELLKNKDDLLKLLAYNSENITKSNIRSKKNETKSFRVDTGLYEAFKKKANKNNDKITDLINSFMEEYISK